MNEGITTRRSSPGPVDMVVAAGAALVLGLLAVAFIVVEPGGGPGVRSSFVLATEERAPSPPPQEAGVVPPAPAPPGGVAAPARADLWTTVTGTARIFASGPAYPAGPQPACDHEWAPQVRMDDGTLAVVSVPGRLSGLVVVADRATWTCEFVYRAQVPEGTGTKPYYPTGF